MFFWHFSYLCSPWKTVGFPVGENIRRTISMSHKMDNSLAFFKIPLFLFEYVTCLLPVLSSRLIFNLTLPILLKKLNCIKTTWTEKNTKGWVFISNSTHFVLYAGDSTLQKKKTLSFNELFSKWSSRRKKTSKALNMETSKLGHRVSLSLENKIHCNGRFKKVILQQRQRKKMSSGGRM